MIARLAMKNDEINNFVLQCSKSPDDSRVQYAILKTHYYNRLSDTFTAASRINEKKSNFNFIL